MDLNTCEIGHLSVLSLALLIMLVVGIAYILIYIYLDKRAADLATACNVGFFHSIYGRLKHWVWRVTWKRLSKEEVDKIPFEDLPKYLTREGPKSYLAERLKRGN